MSTFTILIILFSLVVAPIVTFYSDGGRKNKKLTIALVVVWLFICALHFGGKI